MRDFSADLEAARNGRERSGVTLEPRNWLEEHRVDLVARIRDGIAVPSYLVGPAPFLRVGKRYLIPAPAGAGKSLALLVVAVEHVRDGGTVVILDVENGADEYAGRLQDILQALDDAAGTVAAACAERLRYYEWPRLALERKDGWLFAVAAASLVIFDSSRMMLETSGLAEDKSDDYAKFVDAWVLPLSRAGITTVILDNTGHDNQDRARGTKAKEDLNEVVYRLKVIQSFDADSAGKVALARARCRFSGLPRELHIPLGGGEYGPSQVVETTAVGGEFRPTHLMEKISRALEAAADGCSNAAIRDSVKGNSEYRALALRVLVEDGFAEKSQDGHKMLYRSLRPYREADEELQQRADEIADRYPDGAGDVFGE